MKREKNLETLLVITVGFLVLYVSLHRKIFLPLALLFGLIGIFSDTLSDWIALFWGKLSQVMGKISGTILLTLIYCIFVVPLALFRKWSGKDSLLLRRGDRTSFYEERNHLYTASDLEDIW
jgi:hypothetical protein